VQARIATLGEVAATLADALTDHTDPALRPLPDDVAGLLLELDAPPRLGAHLRAVHDVACRLVDAITEHWPELVLDAAAVRYGAAVHDIGKVRHPAELSGPGSEHERTGYELLLARGVDEPSARFARTHAAWTGPGIRTEDLVVSVADKIWKARRVPDLEQLLLTRLAAAAGVPAWEAFLTFDDVLTALAADAPGRLEVQARYPIRSAGEVYG
jgi:hypothetical protein